MSNTPVIYKFQLKTSAGDPRDVMSSFRPGGQIVLNTNIWRGREPRSCGIANVKFRNDVDSGGDGSLVEIDVEYRPKGYISFVGGTKYDGWTAMMLDQQKDGTLLDGKGEPLKEGEQKVYLAYDVFKDTDFDNLNFGELIDEVEFVEDVQYTYDEVMKLFQESDKVSMSIHSTFHAPRRHRPPTKIIVSGSPSGVSSDGFRGRVVNINKFTPHLDQAILDSMTELIYGIVEGRYSMKNMSSSELVFLDLDDAFVDCTRNELGKDSKFNCLGEFVPDSFLCDLAKRLEATFQIKVSLVKDRAFAMVLSPDARHE